MTAATRFYLTYTCGRYEWAGENLKNTDKKGIIHLSSIPESEIDLSDRFGLPTIKGTKLIS